MSHILVEVGFSGRKWGSTGTIIMYRSYLELGPRFFAYYGRLITRAALLLVRLIDPNLATRMSTQEFLDRDQDKEKLWISV